MRSRESFVLFLAFLYLLIYVKADFKSECRKETGVSSELLKKFATGSIGQDDHKLKCYVACVMRKYGVYNSKNEIDFKRVMQYIPPYLQSVWPNLYRQCKGVTGTDSCDQAYQIVKCYTRSYPEISVNNYLV